MKVSFTLLITLFIAQVTAQELAIVSHLTRASGGFTTTVLIENHRDSALNLQLQPFLEDGRQLDTVPVNLEPQSILRRDAGVLLAPDTAYFTYPDSDGLKVTIAYQAANGPGSPAHLASSQITSQSWRIFPGNWQVTFDGIAIVNRGSVSTDILIEQRSLDGNSIAQVEWVQGLEPGAKTLMVLGGPQGSPFNRDLPCTFEVHATSLTAITSLRGTPPGAAVGYLWENPAVPIEAQQPPPPHPTEIWASRGIGGGGALFSPSFSPHRTGEIFMACDMSELFHSTDFGTSWEMVPFDQIQADAPTKVQFTSDPNLLFAIDTGNDQATPSMSTDGGSQWTPLLSDPTEGETFALQVDPTGTDRLVLASYGELFFSDNRGQSFKAIYEDETGLGAYVAGSFWDRDLIVVALQVGLLVSVDGGATFDLNPLTGVPDGEGLVSFAAGSSTERTLMWAVTQGLASIYPGMTGEDAWGYRGVYQLHWGVSSWTTMNDGIQTDTYPMFVDMARNDPDRAYLGGASDEAVPVVYRLEGDSWVSTLRTNGNQNITTGWCGDGGDQAWWYPEYVLGLAVHPQDPDVLMFTDLGMGHLSIDGGMTWRQMYVDPSGENPAGQETPAGRTYRGNGLENTSVWWLAWSDATQIFAAFTDISGIRSEDGGMTWSFNYEGHDLNSMYYVMHHPTQGRLYGATSSVHDMYQSPWLEDDAIDPGTGQVLQSSDQGASWTVVRDFGHPVIWLAGDPNQPNRMYASVIHSTEGGIYRTESLSQGAGASWTRTAAPPRTEGHPFNLQVLNDGTLVCTYSGRRHNGEFTPSAGVFVSTDQGTTWIDRSDPAMRFWTKDLIVDPHDPGQNTWYVGVWSGWGGAPNGLGGLYRSENRGTSWIRIVELDRVSSLAINPNNRDHMYLTTETDGLWFSTNGSAPLPTYQRDTNYPFRQPERVFFNPHKPTEIWVCSFGNGLRVRQGGN